LVDLSHNTILIVDFLGARKLRERLVSTGASVHIVKPAGALIWARCKKIHAAFISLEDASMELCEKLAGLTVRPIIVTMDEKTGVASASTSWRSALRRSVPSGVNADGGRPGRHTTSGEPGQRVAVLLLSDMPRPLTQGGPRL
jgi:hypothetical protein